MKRIGFLALSLLLVLSAMAQDKSLNEVRFTPAKFLWVKNAASIESILPGNELINEYLRQNVQIPNTLLQFQAEGTAVVQFTINIEGNLEDFKVLNSVSHEIDNELIRTLKTTDGMWVPSRNNDGYISTSQEASLVFYMSDISHKPYNQRFDEMAIHGFSEGNTYLFEKKNMNKALKNYNYAMRYRPFDQALLLHRGLCKYELGDKEGAIQDWSRIKDLDMSSYTENHTELQKMKGYAEMTALLKK